MTVGTPFSVPLLWDGELRSHEIKVRHLAARSRILESPPVSSSMRPCNSEVRRSGFVFFQIERLKSGHTLISHASKVKQGDSLFVHRLWPQMHLRAHTRTPPAFGFGSLGWGAEGFQASGLCYHTGVCEKTLLLPEPWPSNPAAETASQPLIWCSESLSSKSSSSPEECLFHRHRYSEHEQLRTKLHMLHD